MKYSEIINKELIDIDTLENYGAVDSIYLKNDFSIEILQSNFGSVIPFDSVASIGDVITVRGCGGDTADKSRLTAPGGIVIDADGKIIAAVNDYDFGKTYKMKYILTDDKNITPARIIRFGKNNVLIKGKKRTISASSAPKTGAIVNSDEFTDNYKMDVNGNITATVVSNYDFLIGRRLTKDISKNGFLIAPDNMIIDSECIKRCTSYGKLVELAIYSIR